MIAELMTDLEGVARSYNAAAGQAERRVIVCAGTGCMANGALKVHEALLAGLAAAGQKVVVELREEADNHGVRLSRSGCQGFCQMGPLVTVEPDGLLYTHVKPEDAGEIVRTTIIGRKPVERLLYAGPDGARRRGIGEIPFYTRQARKVLRRCGVIDPEDIREYIAGGGYAMARRAWREMTPQDVCREILASGLRGRGGGGFPTGRKWELALAQPGTKKYVICNGDEGDPGAFMNRSVMEGDPHAVIEGMMIAARAIGADEGVVYVRTEYPLAVARMRRAIADAEAAGLLGGNVFGTGAALRLSVMEGAGAFVCGEETAMIASIEGRRGMPGPKPPFPAQRGLWGKPTVINNVETLATTPYVLQVGAAEYRKRGTEKSPGTKTFALTGHVVNTGLIEVPFGATLREIVFHVGGGVTDRQGRVSPDGFKAAQIGGPSGGCLTAAHLDLPLDFDSLRGIGAMVGSGGLVVMNRDTCIVSVARFFMQFTQNESCAKCVLCREGTRQMLALLDDITEGRADAGTLALLEQLARVVGKASLCGLGKTAPNPVLSTLRHFREEYEDHVLRKRCPTGQCKALAVPEIVAARCRGCGLCAKICPASAISGEKRQAHRIDAQRCVKCGACAKACKFDAVAGL